MKYMVLSLFFMLPMAFSQASEAQCRHLIGTYIRSTWGPASPLGESMIQITQHEGEKAGLFVAMPVNPMRRGMSNWDWMADVRTLALSCRRGVGYVKAGSGHYRFARTPSGMRMSFHVPGWSGTAYYGRLLQEELFTGQDRL